MSGTKFVYATYIRATPEALWDALTKPEFTRIYWAGTEQKSDWTVGSAWGAYTPDGRLWDIGEILEVDHPRKLAFTWRNEHFPEVRAEGFTRLSYELEPAQDATKLTLVHEIDVDNSKGIGACSQGWPAILASLKSLMETGKPLAATTRWPEGL